MQQTWQVMKTQTIDLGYEQMLALDGLPAGQVRVQFRGEWIGRADHGPTLRGAGPEGSGPLSPARQWRRAAEAMIREILGGLGRIRVVAPVRLRLRAAAAALS